MQRGGGVLDPEHHIQKHLSSILCVPVAQCVAGMHRLLLESLLYPLVYVFALRLVLAAVMVARSRSQTCLQLCSFVHDCMGTQELLCLPVILGLPFLVL